MKKRRIAIGTAIVAILALLLEVFSSSTALPNEETALTATATISRVVDGDTIVVMIGDEEEKVRILGIDAPETVDPNEEIGCFGPEASAALSAELTAGETVTLVPDLTQDNRDRYDRLLRYVEEEGNHDIGFWLIQNGYAYEYTHDYSFERMDAYKQAEESARKAKRGLWGADCVDTTSHE